MHDDDEVRTIAQHRVPWPRGVMSSPSPSGNGVGVGVATISIEPCSQCGENPCCGCGIPPAPRVVDMCQNESKSRTCRLEQSRLPAKVIYILSLFFSPFFSVLSEISRHGSSIDPELNESYFLRPFSVCLTASIAGVGGVALRFPDRHCQLSPIVQLTTIIICSVP